MLVTDTDEYVKSVLRKALGEDKANLLIDRILQGSDTTGIESLKWMDRPRWPSCCATSTRRSWPPSWCTWNSTRRPRCSSSFGERPRNEVMVRIATLDGIQPNGAEAT